MSHPMASAVPNLVRLIDGFLSADPEERDRRAKERHIKELLREMRRSSTAPAWAWSKVASDYGL